MEQSGVKVMDMPLGQVSGARIQKGYRILQVHTARHIDRVALPFRKRSVTFRLVNPLDRVRHPSSCDPHHHIVHSLTRPSAACCGSLLRRREHYVAP